MSAACVVCGGDDLRPHLRVAASDGLDLVATTTAYGSAPADILRCATCGHMQVAEFPKSGELDEGYSEVSEGAYLDEEVGQRATAVRAMERIERHVGPGTLCDLGCWVGFLVSEAERRGWEASGVEPSSFAAEFGRERLGVAVRIGTIDSVELPEAAFDAIVMGDVIEHLPMPGTALGKVRRALRDRGILYLALPDAGSRVARMLGTRWWSVLPTHVQYFTQQSLVRLLDQHGFTAEWLGTAPKAFSVRYYLQRLEGYSEPLAASAVGAARAVGIADKLVWPDFRDRMAVVARRRGS